MSIWEIILIGAGLSMDAAAVSVSNTLCLKKITLKHILMMCLSFGLFQCLMPIIGYFGASLFQDYIKNVRSLDCVSAPVVHRRKNGH